MSFKKTLQLAKPDREKIKNWLSTNCIGAFTFQLGPWVDEVEITFDLEVDATFFTLKWEGIEYA